MAVTLELGGETRFIVQAGGTKPTIASQHVSPKAGDTCWDATANIIYKTYDGTNWVTFATMS
jgi:hypothetical protein